MARWCCQRSRTSVLWGRKDWSWSRGEPRICMSAFQGYRSGKGHHSSGASLSHLHHMLKFPEMTSNWRTLAFPPHCLGRMWSWGLRVETKKLTIQHRWLNVGFSNARLLGNHMIFPQWETANLMAWWVAGSILAPFPTVLSKPLGPRKTTPATSLAVVYICIFVYNNMYIYIYIHIDIYIYIIYSIDPWIL